MDLAYITVHTSDWPIPERTYTWHGKKHWPVKISMGLLSDEEREEIPWKLTLIDSDDMRLLGTYRRSDLNVFTGLLYYWKVSFINWWRMIQCKIDATRKIWRCN